MSTVVAAPQLKTSYEMSQLLSNVAKPVKTPAVFTPPTIGCRMVQWHQHADKTAVPMPAIVQSGNKQGVLTITVLQVNSMNLRTLHGVLHVDDPRLKKLEDAALTSGGWDLLPEDREQQKRLSALEAQVQELTDLATSSKLARK